MTVDAVTGGVIAVRTALEMGVWPPHAYLGERKKVPSPSKPRTLKRTRPNIHSPHGPQGR